MTRIKEMYTAIVKYLMKGLIDTGIIQESDSAIYYFGLYEGGVFVFNILITLLIASVIQSLWVGVIFFLAFFPLRRMSGGYHAKTREGCFGVSLLIIIGAMKGIGIVNTISYERQVMVMIFVALWIYFLSPVQNARKPLNIAEIQIY